MKISAKYDKLNITDDNIQFKGKCQQLFVCIHKMLVQQSDTSLPFTPQDVFTPHRTQHHKFLHNFLHLRLTRTIEWEYFLFTQQAIGVLHS